MYELEQILGLLGAVLILVGYFFMVLYSEYKVLSLLLSLLGGITLLLVALMYQNLGLIVLELAWIAINTWGLYKALRYNIQR